MITLHTIINERDPEASGRIIIRDGGQDSKIIQDFPIDNGTFPQSITTKTNIMFIQMEYSLPPTPPSGVDPTKRCKHLRACIRFMLELTTDFGNVLNVTLLFSD
jgi:hypothetical protein